MPDYKSYDVIVVGAGTAGCIVASRIAEKGINPATGDRLRVAAFEGGPYIIQGKEKPRPGYGTPSRRQAVVNINYLGYRPTPWPYDGHQNKMVGGCGLHWGGNAYVPFSEDYDHWREASGVNWTEAAFKGAVDEIVETHNIHPSVSENMVLGNNLFRDGAGALGYQATQAPMARTNCINCGYCGSGHFCKYDAKGTSLYYMHLAEQNGVEFVPDSEVERIIIEKQGGRARATGIYYTQNGQRVEARAPKIIVTCGTAGTPVLLMRSGYGPREVLGDRLVVENNNIGRYLDGDVNHNVEALFGEDIKGARGGVERYQFGLTNSQGKFGDHNLQFFDTNLSAVDEAYPHVTALHRFAPELGWEHKNYMKNACKRFGSIAVRLRSPSWETGTVNPAGRFEYTQENPKILKTLKEGTELVVELYDKMAVRPIKMDRNLPNRHRIAHQTSSCRAGESAKNSVVNSDFESHDVENLFVSSAAVIPRAPLSHSHIPTCVVAAYTWRRMVENHFSRGA